MPKIKINSGVIFMKCKYCGKDVRPVGPNLESDDNGYNCPASVSKKHAIIPDGSHCIHCGRETKILGDRVVTSYGIRCSASPSERHAIQ